MISIPSTTVLRTKTTDTHHDALRDLSFPLAPACVNANPSSRTWAIVVVIIIRELWYSYLSTGAVTGRAKPLD
jgi:hypothetical protein